MRRDAMLSWLRGGAVVTGDGAVLSWENPEHPGYPYPEAAGLVLALFSLEGTDLPLRDRVAARLCDDVAPDGALGRGASAYAFDAGVALTGLLAHERAGGVLADPVVPSLLADFIIESLATRRPVRGPAADDPMRWSASYGSHLLKTTIALSLHHERTGDARATEVIGQLTRELLPLCEGGRFRIHARSRDTYVHACCYALEALHHLARRGTADAEAMLHEGAAWLARAQDASGALRAWHDGERAHGDPRADATAQAVRLWCAVDRAAYADAIARAEAFLAAVAAPSGALRYGPGSGDANTWATVFAAQAARWARQGPGREWAI